MTRTTDATEAMGELALAAEQVNANLDSVQDALTRVASQLAALNRRREAGEKVRRKEYRAAIAEFRRAMRAMEELMREAAAIKSEGDALAGIVKESLSLPKDRRN